MLGASLTKQLCIIHYHVLKHKAQMVMKHNDIVYDKRDMR